MERVDHRCRICHWSNVKCVGRRRHGKAVPLARTGRPHHRKTERCLSRGCERLAGANATVVSRRAASSDSRSRMMSNGPPCPFRRSSSARCWRPCRLPRWRGALAARHFSCRKPHRRYGRLIAAAAIFCHPSGCSACPPCSPGPIRPSCRATVMRRRIRPRRASGPKPSPGC